jgi:23S rRNA (cytosine1962-C5)-methyltransferase
MSRLILKKGKEESVKRFHPWIFSGAILRTEGNPEEGDLVDLYSSGGEFLGCGHYQFGSIALRILTFDNSAKDASFWDIAVSSSIKKREVSGIFNSGSGTNAFRIVNGEGDNLPGLIVDFYNGTAVMQCHSAGMLVNAGKIATALKNYYGHRLLSVYNKSSATAPKKEGFSAQDSYLLRGQDNATVSENGILFKVDWEEGQKTGFFLDQRENRKIVMNMAGGRRVLNLFCYTGGFSLYALAGGAVKVHSVDSSKRALSLLEENIDINIREGILPDSICHTSVCADVMEYLKEIQEREFEIIIVDPPAFAKHRGAIQNALRAYQRLNAKAIEKVASGGLIFTFSCSQAIDKISFSQAIFSAAASTGRRVSIVNRLTQPYDHPVNIYHPEGEYLKGLVLLVE